MANSKINTVNVGGVDFQIQAASGSSDSGFVDDTIEAALKNLIDSFSVDGTYTGRFKATNTPNKWFSYQIDLFDNIASGYIVNTIDPEESYTVRYRRQTDEQATISSIGKTIAEHEDAISQINNDLTAIRSHVGMIVQSTTLDTEAKVIAIYGGTSWSKIEGKFLLGQSSSHAVNSTGGSETVTLNINQIPSHSHSYASASPSSGYYVDTSMSGSGPRGWTAYTTGAQGGGQAHNNMPPYKVVYIWERTA